MSRPTRKERQATTRNRLLEAAARVFCRRGIDQASVDEVAEDAGFTKGAFYSNFKNKEELFLAMLDRSFAERLGEIEAAVATDAPIHAQARRAGEDFTRAMAADPEWERLFFEFAAHALRDEPFREELVIRYRSLREAIAAALPDTLPLSPERIAVMTFAMGNGLALERLLEPDAVRDDDYPTMLEAFVRGLEAMAVHPEKE